MRTAINALRTFINSLKENQTEILTIVIILFILSLIVKILHKIANRNQETQYEQSLQMISLEHNLSPDNLIKNKIIDYIIKFIVIAILFILFVFAIGYVAGLIWGD